MEVTVLEEFHDVDFGIIKNFNVDDENINVEIEEKHGIVQVVKNMVQDNPDAVMLIGYEVINGQVGEGHIAVCTWIDLENAEQGQWKLKGGI